MKHALTLALGLSAAVIHPLAASTQEEDVRMIINKINDTDFEVIEKAQTMPRGFWCGAAYYVEVRQGKSGLTPIYLKSARGPAVTAPGRKGVVFSTSAAGLPPDEGGLTIGVETPGRMLKSNFARSFCRDAFTRATK